MLRLLLTQRSPVVGFQDVPAVKTLISHLIKQASSNKPLHTLLTTLLAPPTPTQSHVGLIISERLINMPVQTQPPLYRMLGEEMAAANANVRPPTPTLSSSPSSPPNSSGQSRTARPCNQPTDSQINIHLSSVLQGKPYAFTHYLLLSKLYLAPNFPNQPNASKANKKQKKKNASAKAKPADAMEVDGEDALLLGHDGGPLPFHPEDSLLVRVRTLTCPLSMSMPAPKS